MKKKERAQIKLDDECEKGEREKREVSHILIYEPSLRFKGNKSNTTCLQTLKCHRSIAQLTPIEAVMSSIEE